MRAGRDATTAVAGSARSAAVGIGLRASHIDEIGATRPAVALLEIHAENYLRQGPALRALERLRSDYPVSVHGVGLSLGSAGGVDRGHLARVRALVQRIDPAFVSEHVSWSAVGGTYLNHLLPLPLTAEALDTLADNVGLVQDVLGRAVLLENPASYLAFRHSTMSEPEFLGALVRRTGAGLLCDVNNVHVSAHNVGFDAAGYLDALPAGAVAELHLAGHAVNDADGFTVLIDDHGSAVAPPVWALFRRAVERFGPVPTVVEWDTALPPLAVLLDEAMTAAAVLAGANHAAAA
jgi:uncharacterized protein (UPF0276 family)